MKNKTPKYLSYFIPKISEIDGYIILILIVSLFILSGDFRNFLEKVVFQSLNKEFGYMIFLVILGSLIISTYYTFNTKKTFTEMPKKIFRLVIVIISMFIGYISLFVGLSYFGIWIFNNSNDAINISNTSDIMAVLIISFAAINLVRVIIFILAINYFFDARLFYEDKNVKYTQLIIISILVPIIIIFFLLLLNSSVLLTFFNTYVITVLIAGNLPHLKDCTRVEA